MGTLENKFSWSNSRAGQFHRCLRAYWWQYYGSWGGWERHGPAEAREAYMLKNLSNRWAWVGTAVHEQIEGILKRIQEGALHGRLQFDGDRPDVQAEIEAMTKRMRTQFRQSRAGAYRDQPKRKFGLSEHEYEIPITDAVWRETNEKAREALRGFLQSDVFERIRASDVARWFPIEMLDQFELAGVGVWAVPDFARRVDDDGVEIYDWKTGRVDPEGARRQMACYTLYVESKYGTDPQKITTRLVYLGPHVEVHDFRFQPDELEASRRDIVASMDEMRARLVDTDANRAERDDFPLTEDRSICATCSYRRLCGR